MPAVFGNVALPRVLTKVTPQKLELAMILAKERRKRLRYLGSFYHHWSDRHHLYTSQGGVNGTKFILDRQRSRVQYHHPIRYKDKYTVRTIKTGGAQYDMIGNLTRERWDLQLFTTNIFNDTSFKRFFRSLDKDAAIEFLEQWGVKYVLLDEMRKPSVQDCMYFKHKLYAHNFPYIPDPVQTWQYGDADYQWKGTEKLDYSKYGATTKDSRNDFRSLWREAARQFQEPVAAAAPTAAAAATPAAETVKAAAPAKKTTKAAAPAAAATTEAVKPAAPAAAKPAAAAPAAATETVKPAAPATPAAAKPAAAAPADAKPAVAAASTATPAAASEPKK